MADASWVCESVVSACLRNIDFLSFYPVARYSCLIAHTNPLLVFNFSWIPFPSRPSASENVVADFG